MTLFVLLGQSDWSEIDQAFSSDDEELFGYFETTSNKIMTQSVQSIDAFSDRQDSLNMSGKAKRPCQLSAEANYAKGASSSVVTSAFQLETRSSKQTKNE